MIKIGFTDQKGNIRPISILKELMFSKEIATLKERANILEDNGETRSKKAFWKKTQSKT